ncbi:MAG: hypothetical protein IPP87_04390 [Ideonella sp.]|jgi:hypothetical protein|nr:hypothetical protein [Ideonella sp.]MBL0147996.1 hypothetical protein [Ideonella sp.]
MSDTADPDPMRALRLRLEAMRRKLDVLSSKPARAEALREIARLRWQLGEIDDAALSQAEDFADGFNYE